MNRFDSTFVPVVRVVDLGRYKHRKPREWESIRGTSESRTDEDIFARYAAFTHRASYLVLVPIITC